jgi:hypothetical protein
VTGVVCTTENLPSVPGFLTLRCLLAASWRLSWPDHLSHPVAVQKSYKRFVIKATALALRESENSFTVHINIRQGYGALL